MQAKVKQILGAARRVEERLLSARRYMGPTGKSATRIKCYAEALLMLIKHHREDYRSIAVGTVRLAYTDDAHWNRLRAYATRAKDESLLLGVVNAIEQREALRELSRAMFPGVAVEELSEISGGAGRPAG